MFYNVFHLFWPPVKLWLILGANQVKSNRFLQKHYTIYFRMTRHGEHPSLKSYLLSNFQCQEKKTGLTEDSSGTDIHRQLLRRFAKFMQLFNDQSIH